MGQRDDVRCSSISRILKPLRRKSVEVRGIEREKIGLWNGYVILCMLQECWVNPLFILCSQTHDIIKLISNIPSIFLNKKLR